MTSPAAPQRSPRRGRMRVDESGVTLIELMVSMVLLGIIFAAAAASLITFTRTAADNERRVQATAVMNALHEEFHTAEWNAMGLYEEELDELLLEGLVAADGAGGYVDADGNPIVLLADLGAAPRDPAAPVPAVTTDVGDREYTIRQIISWVDRTGSGELETKRMTTFVSWSLLNRTYTERFDSERAATPDEAGDPTRPRVIHFLAGPKSSELNVSDENISTIAVSVRFSQPVESATLQFYSLDASDLLQLRTVSLTPQITTVEGTLSFTGSIPALAYRFPDGSRILRAVGVEGGELSIGYTGISFSGGTVAPIADPDVDDADIIVPEEPEGGGEEDSTLPPLVIQTVATPEPTSVCLLANNRFAETLTVKAYVKGLTASDYQVTASYTNNSATVTGDMVPEGTVAESGSWFKLVLSAGTNHGFVGGNKTNFDVVASRPQSDGAHTAPEQSAQVMFLDHKAPGC